MTYTLGIDFGTGSARALIVRTADGEELATAVSEYASGTQGVLLSDRQPLLARQHPGDYLESMTACVREALAQACDKARDFAPGQIVGIGVDATGSSPIPVDIYNRALGMAPQFERDLAAQCWLWKDHTSHEEAELITKVAREQRPALLARVGGTYSSEWWWSKILHCLRTAPEVFENAASWVELSDWIPSQLAGITDPARVVRNVCAAGHKALFAHDLGGLPDAEFLSLLDPRLVPLRDRLYDHAYDASTRAGRLSDAWAERLGLPADIPIAVGALDVHYGAIGSGIGAGSLVKVIGTSSCDVAVLENRGLVPDEVPGICGIVDGSILPGHFGIEAGQSAVGDLFHWWVDVVCEGSGSLHEELTRDSAEQAPGQHGLLALDWNNGNRNVLVDPRLTGLLIGQTLHTTRADVYRALLEATAFGARTIVERLEEHGVPIERIVCAGGIAAKNPLLMQIYADVLGREMCLAGSTQACALGSAITAAVVAGAHPDFATAQHAMTRLSGVSYRPNSAARTTYQQLFGIYQQLHDAFGGVAKNVDLGGVMKQLLALRSG